MLSPGQFHKRVPREMQANIRWRLYVAEKAKGNRELQQAVCWACKNDIIFFINTFIIQINPELRELGPFILFPYQEVAILGGEVEIGGEKYFQEGLLACVEDRKDVRWPKSREGGASWIVLMVIEWLCNFHVNVNAGAISRDEDSVDKLGDPNSLFEKVRVMLKYLPDWMNKISKDKKMGFQWSNGNTFTGEANVGSANVGGRLTILLIDEFGQFDKNGEEIYDFTSDVTHCRVFVFTHKDQSGMAYQLCYDAKFQGMRQIITHWSQHPLKNKGLYRVDKETGRPIVLDKQFDFTKIKDFQFVTEYRPVGGPCPGIRSPWYDEEDKRRSERDRSMNLDIDPKGASDQFFDPYRIGVLKAEHCRPPRWVGNLSYDKTTGTPKELIEDQEGFIKLWISPKSSRELPRMRAGAGADISAGVGASPQCLSVMNADSGEKVLEYANANIFQIDFAVFCVAILNMFKDEDGTHPMLIWEIQFAMAFEMKIRELFYRPFWIRRDESAIGKPRDNKGRAGQSTSRGAFYRQMTEYRHDLYNGNVINRSEIAMDENLNFVYTSTGEGVIYKPKGKAKQDGSGAKIHHGDIPVADSLAAKVIREMGSDGRPIEAETKYPRPGSWEFREWLHDKRRAEEEDEVWA